jgi:biopolymer transport protein ExbD
VSINKRNKILYVPGLFSLVLLPLFGLTYFLYNGAFEKQHSIEICYPVCGVNFPPFAKNNNRKFKTIDIRTNSDIGFEKSANIKSLISIIQAKKDTINGLHIHFSDSTNYQTYITILNTILKSKINYVQPEYNDIWLCYQPKGNRNWLNPIEDISLQFGNCIPNIN